MSGVEIIAAAIAAAGSAYAGIQSQKTARANAEAYQMEAAFQKKRAEIEAQVQKKQGEKLLGAQRSAYLKSGVDITGTPLSVLAQSAYDLEWERQLIEAGGEYRAASAEQQARVQRMRGNQFMAAGFAEAGSSLLSGVGKWYYRKYG